IVVGDPNQTAEVIDVWTFARNTRSRDPNWLLVATETPQSRRRGPRRPRGGVRSPTS
ncbi:MAG: TIM44-like domain-containing protein, partial [Alphaproteobacteria bacterium]